MPLTYNLPWWYPKFYKEGAEYCSEYPHLFHKVKPEIMYQMEYLIYDVKVWSKNSKSEVPGIDKTTNSKQTK